MDSLSVNEILSVRENRKIAQQKLLDKYGENLISMTMNIPGAIKNSQEISKAFARAYFKLIEILKAEGYHIKFIELNNPKSGPLGFISIQGDSYELKRILVKYEESISIGRLLDIDILHDKLGIISRTDLDIDVRSCFLCDQPANVCRRLGSHSQEELKVFVNNRLDNYNTWKK